ncbi:DUF3899 domain-containing protein [Paenibacillus alvei]|uniref:DUF3899 domain-containing protein n=2 Tax=Paenibacillus alvei TaxID=44250 RepID=A0AAP7DK48_PAEAL|nr:DUF3899 domain-containing protein [Paenibacillus alvei]NOJ72580.1 DUF3899 domain-containing protein [Paenibacillus alvei]
MIDYDESIIFITPKYLLTRHHQKPLIQLDTERVHKERSYAMNRLLLLVTLLFTVGYSILNGHNSLLINLSNSFFIIGLIYLLIALLAYVRNIGFFKSLSYHLHRKQKEKEQALHYDSGDVSLAGQPQKRMALHEYADLIRSNQWSSKILYLFSIPLLLCSCILAIFAT